MVLEQADGNCDAASLDVGRSSSQDAPLYGVQRGDGYAWTRAWYCSAYGLVVEPHGARVAIGVGAHDGRNRF